MFTYLGTTWARDKNARRDAPVSSDRPEEEVLLSGMVSGRGALFRKVSSAHTVRRRPSVLPKRKCREATTGNRGSSGSGSTEVSICSLGLVICVLDITARDLRCVSAISRTRARVSSPARRGAARRVAPASLLLAFCLFRYPTNEIVGSRYRGRPICALVRPGSDGKEKLRREKRRWKPPPRNP